MLKPERVVSAAFSKDGRFLLLCTGLTAEVWSLEIFQRLKIVHGVSGADFLHGSFSPDGRQFYTMGERQNVRIWETVSGAALTSFWCPEHRMALPTFSPDGRWIMTTSNDAEDHTIYVHSVRTEDLLRKAEHLVPASLKAEDRQRLLEAW